MNLHALYFSPTKTTKTIVEAICSTIGEEVKSYDITLQKNRHSTLEFEKDDCLVIGLPVYGGRIPEMTEAFLLRLKGQNTRVILVAVYGNRHYDDALLEMKNILANQGFISIAAGAFIGEHSYTPNVATERPDSSDLKKCRDFGSKVKILLDQKSINEILLSIKGDFPYCDRPSPAPVGPTVSTPKSHDFGVLLTLFITVFTFFFFNIINYIPILINFKIATF
jgi:flavodoxin